MVYGLYLPYHKNEFLCVVDEGYKEMPDYPIQFRKVRVYDKKKDALWAYANTLCPASQLIEAIDKKDLDAKIKEMDKNFSDPEWLKEHIYPYV